MKIDELRAGDAMKTNTVAGIDERGPLPWEKFFDQIEDFAEGWLFRGCQRAKWDLETSLERHVPSDQKSSQAEGFLLREFKRRADVYLNANQVPETTIEWLALMQHFGAPTRLLDMTKSPYVAAYFAVESVTSNAGAACAPAVNRDDPIAAC